MNDSLIREIAQQIVRQEILTNWVFYALILSVSVISTALSVLVASYIRKRAETYASKADLEELIRQLKETTEAAEEVKVAISHEDWAMREWKTLRRVKLEELFTAVQIVTDWLEKEMTAACHNEWASESSPFPQVERLVTLYFPELLEDGKALHTAYFDCLSWTSVLRREALVLCGLAERGELKDTGDIEGALQAISEKGTHAIRPWIDAQTTFLTKTPLVLKSIQNE